MHLVLINLHVNIVACLYRYYTCNWVNIDEASQSCLCDIHYINDCKHDYNVIVIDYIQNECNRIHFIFK